MNKVELLCFADASLGNLTGNASQRGHITFLLRGNKRYAPIAWQSKKIPQVVKSTLAAETLALQEGSEHCCALKASLSDNTSFQTVFTLIVSLLLRVCK